jgi:MYXO-CTERM domain-containing protein
VLATDGVESRTVYRNITVNNVAPEITSTPPLDAAVRREYVYDVLVDDPAGANDPITYLLTSRPPGMEIAGSLIAWTPLPEHRGRSYPVILRIDDGDSGEDSQTWEVSVAFNTPPSLATPVSPIMHERVPAGEPVTLVAQNGSDDDGDPLTYFFQLSRVSSFQPPDLIGSGEVSEGADGTTMWTTSEPLEPGLWYWQVWVSDGVVETSPRYAQLVVGEQSVETDGGTTGGDAGVIPGIDAGTTRPPSGGCSVGAASSAGGSLALLALALALVIRRRR